MAELPECVLKFINASKRLLEFDLSEEEREIVLKHLDVIKTLIETNKGVDH